jgi:hypothetical protein
MSLILHPHPGAGRMRWEINKKGGGAVSPVSWQGASEQLV